MANIPFRSFFSRIKLRFGRLTWHAKTILIIVALVLVAAIGFGVWKLGTKPPTVAEQKQQVTATVNQINTQNYKTALDSSKKLVADMPANSPERYTALTNLGIAYVANHQPDQALAAFKEAESIKGDGTSYSIFVMMAQIYEQKGDKTQAIAYYQKAIKRTKATPEDSDDLYVPSYEAAIKRLQQ